jgi:hypothetical protein
MKANLRSWKSNPGKHARRRASWEGTVQGSWPRMRSSIRRSLPRPGSSITTFQGAEQPTIRPLRLDPLLSRRAWCRIALFRDEAAGRRYRAIRQTIAFAVVIGPLLLGQLSLGHSGSSHCSFRLWGIRWKLIDPDGRDTVVGHRSSSAISPRPKKRGDNWADARLSAKSC